MGSYLLRCDCRLMNGIRDTAEQGSVFYTDTFRSYTSLKLFGKQRTVDHNTECITGRRHSNGLEGFWSCAQERRLQYHGVSKNHCLVYRTVKWRYNYRNQNLFHPLIKIHVSPFLT